MCLFRSDNGRANLNTGCAKRKSSPYPAPVCDGTGGNDGNGYGIKHLRQQREQADLRIPIGFKKDTAMPAAFPTLRDDGVRTPLLEPLRLCHRGCGAKDLTAFFFQRGKRLVRLVEQSKMKTHDCGGTSQEQFELLGSKGCKIGLWQS